LFTVYYYQFILFFTISSPFRTSFNTAQKESNILYNYWLNGDAGVGVFGLASAFWMIPKNHVYADI